MSMKRSLIWFVVIPLLVTVVGGLVVFFFSNPETSIGRASAIAAWFNMPVTMPLWQLILIPPAAILLSLGYVRFRRGRRGDRVRLGGVEWIKLDDVTPTPLCPECGQHAFLVEARGDLRCRVKCSGCKFERPSEYGKAELLDKVGEKFGQKEARRRLPPGDENETDR